jgi:hypothetical protein
MFVNNDLRAVQDDAREEELINLFQLQRIPGAKRQDTDAVLRVNGVEVAFELKSATKQGVTTARDFGPEHVQKWKNKHWIFGFYSEGRTTWALDRCYYASPREMAPWIDKKAEYIRLDFELADVVPTLIGLDVLYTLVGQKDEYGYDDAFLLQKRQYKRSEYLELMDGKGVYSRTQMLSILQARCRYLLRRGSTLNNPHIESSFIQKLTRIDKDHAASLRSLVTEYLQERASTTDLATA